jgi:hypothetical protein
MNHTRKPIPRRRYCFVGAVWVVHAEIDRIVEKLGAILLAVSATKRDRP